MSNIFDNENTAIQQLLNDKHTLLEGYVTEQLFFNQFLKYNRVPHSNGWWVTSYNGTKLLFVVKEQLNQLDLEIMNKIQYPNQCWQVYLKGDEFIFIKGEEILCEREFINKFMLSKIREPMVASEDVRNIKRQNRAILFFKENGVIKKIAVERRFANNFLTVYFKKMINVDFFTKKNNHLNVIEVKYKYESKDGYFGINIGQMDMFKIFLELGFNVYHFILYNHTRDKDISIFGFLDLPDENKIWYYANINDTIIFGTGIAPEKTSVSGKFKQPYYKISAGEIENNKILFKDI